MILASKVAALFSSDQYEIYEAVRSIQPERSFFPDLYEVGKIANTFSFDNKNYLQLRFKPHGLCFQKPQTPRT